jgi:signal peptidase I
MSDEGAVDAPVPDDDVKERSTAWWVFEWVCVIAVALVLALGVRAFVIQTFYIPSGSMEPTLKIGDRILVFKGAYWFAKPAIGDVVVFKAPPTEHCGGEVVTDLVKRIIAGPGDRIYSSGNKIYVAHGAAKFHLLVQRWPHYPLLLNPIVKQTIPANRYFMMGDNHPASCDSRDWGTLARNNIIGKVVLRIWPLRQFSTI